MDWTSIVLGGLTLLGGCAWFVNFRKDKQEAKGIRADNRQKEMDLSKMYVDELTFGLPPSRLGNAHASMALRSAWRRFNLNIVVPLTIVDLCRDSAKLMRAWLCARCSIGCNREFRGWSHRLSACTMRLKGLTAALIGLSVLCLAGCASTRQATSSHNEQLKVLSQESEQVRAESFELARDTLIEVLGRAKRQSRVLL